MSERYAVQRVLGQGGSAVVCLAQDLRHSRPVAIKVLRPEISLIVGADRFLHEIETVARLQHPHILPLYDSGEAGGLLYFVMPYVQGESLRERLEREKQLPVDDAVTIAREVASALAFAHSRGVVHRDIKPENIMLFGGAAVVADFGIARVLHVAGDARTTDRGLALGTPLYMSPEQASASGDVDARSDQYSLACVLYEMLSGVPPFTGVSPADVMAHHVNQQPRPIAELRTTVPPPLAVATARALAKVPADRFATITEFADALRGPSGEHLALRRTARRWGLTAALAAAGVVLLVLRSRGPRPDPHYFYVPPFAHRSSLAPAFLSAGNCANYLRQSLMRWTGLRVVDGVQTADILGRDEPIPPGVAGAARQARELGAGRLILGDVWAVDTLVHVHASLYDAASPRTPLAQQEVVLGANPTPGEMSRRFDQLADSLVASSAGQRHPTTVPGVFGTRSLEALLAFATGDSALYVWNLALADSQFRAARDADPDYAYAWLRVAQVGQWLGSRPSDYAADAARALAGAARLLPADSGHAVALAALGAGRFQDACEQYRQLTRRNPDDAFAWFGLGDCLSRDRVVQRSPASPSGWRFRASYREAITAFTRALRSAPSVARVFEGPAFERLATLYYTEPNIIRVGHPERPDTGVYGAFPGLDHDTLAFVARPLVAVREGGTDVEPAGRAEAVRRNRDTLLAITATWTTAFPSRPEAWAARAHALEAEGVLEGSGDAGSAVAAVRAGRTLHPTGALARDLATTAIRLQLKTGSFEAAARTADSALAPPASGSASQQRAAILALRGRVGEAATALEAAADDSVYLSNSVVVLPSDLRRQVGRLEAFASFELPVDSVRGAMRRVQQAAGSYFPGPQRAEAVWALLSHPMSMAFGETRGLVLHPGPAGPDNGLRWQLMLERGDTAGVRRQMREQDAMRERLRMLPGDVDVEGVFNEARIALAIGDTAQAVRRLDGTLAALSTLQRFVLDRVPPAAALVRAMALRAELAAHAHDGATARRWAGAVATLWNGSDAALAGTLARMHALANEDSLH